jgi:large subunit ribosomal protein L9
MANAKLLLIEDVESLGRSGDIVTVRPGYARNFLLPQGLALVADQSALRMQARLQEERRKKAIQDKKEADELAVHIEGKTLTTIVKVDQEGHMYGSVSATDIVHLFQEQENLTVEKRGISLKHALKEIGVHNLTVKLKEGVIASFTLKIVPEEEKNAELAQKKPEVIDR